MKLAELLVDTKLAWIEFPGCEGFEVEVANLSRKELVNLRKKCLKTRFDRKTRQAEEELDDEKFVNEFTKATIKNWKGFKLKYLEDLLLVDLIMLHLVLRHLALERGTMNGDLVI